MSLVLHYLKNHYCAILLAIVVGIIIISPQLFFRWELGKDYHGIYMSGTDNEEYYTGRIREVFDGHYLVGNPFLYEQRNNVFFQPPLGEWMFLPLKYVFFGNFTAAIVWGTRFIFPAIAFLIVYGFYFLLTRNKLTSIAISTFIVLGLQMAFFPKDFLYLLQIKFEQISNTNFLTFSRPIIPETSVIIFYAFLFVFFKSLEKQRVWLAYFAGVIYGLSLYAYIYDWIFLTVSIALFCAYYAFKRQGKILFCAARACIMGIVVSIPYWILFFISSKSEFFTATAERYNLYISHAPVFSKLLFLGFVLLFLAYYREKKDQRFIFFLLLLVSGFVVINQQIITGRVLFYGHFHWYFNTPVVIAVAVFSLQKILEKLNNIVSRVFLILVVIISFFYALNVQTQSYKLMFPKYKNIQSLGLVYNWLEKNYTDERVILSNNREFSNSIPTYTHHYPYDGIYAHLFLSDPERLKQNIFLQAWMAGVEEKNTKEYFLSSPKLRNDIAGLLGGARNRRIYGCNECIPDELMAQYADEYSRFLYSRGYENMQKNIMNIIVWDLDEKIDLPEYFLKNAKKIIQIEQFSIYDFPKK